MSEFFLYAERSSIEILNNACHKVILVGSDFGYPNFGDVLQLKGVVTFHQRIGTLVPVPVFDVESISSPTFVGFLKRFYGVDVILFVSRRAYDLAHLDMVLVDEIREVSALHLYGGGMLNSMWGAYVLDVAEYFLQRAPGVTYVVSGQQIGVEIRDRLVEHISQFEPKLFGVRDYDSLQRMSSWGLRATYSFDDAYEAIINLSAQIPLNRGDRVVAHLNVSSYTNDNIEERMGKIVKIFERIRSDFPHYRLTLVNAYNDKRFDVCDSLGSVVRLENDFPFKSYAVVDLAMAAYSGEIDDPNLLAGQIGISCSYHVTMFLHLAGIPCWLISENQYYEQKARSLNCDLRFEEFMNNPQIPDYSSRIEARAAWLEQLELAFDRFSKLSVNLCFNNNGRQPADAVFRFKAIGVDELKAYITELLPGKEWLENQWKSATENLAKREAELERERTRSLSYRISNFFGRNRKTKNERE